MWELVKALAFLIVAIPAVILSCIGLIFQWVQGLIEKSSEHKQAELDAREEALAEAERQRNILGPHADTQVLENHAVALFEQGGFPKWEDFLDAFRKRYRNASAEKGEQIATQEAEIALITALVELYIQEWEFAEPSQRLIAGEIQAGRYRDELIAFVDKIKDPGKLLDVFSRKLLNVATTFTNRMPPFARQDIDTPYVEPSKENSVKLIDTLSGVGTLIEELIEPFSDEESKELRLFEKFKKQYEANELREKHKPSEDKRRPAEIVAAFLKDTKLKQIFDCTVPFEIPISRRLEHTAIVAGSGWGKTQLLQSIIARDLAKPNPPAIVVIDSTGAMVRRIQRLAVFNERLKDRLVIIDPEQTPVPALNMFDISNPRFQGYDESLRESIESEIVALFNYVFSSTENPLTAEQATPFAFMVRLLLSMPGANIGTLIELLDDNPRNGFDGAAPHFKEAITRLDETAQTFFRTQYYSRGTSEARRDQIAQRVYGIIKIPAFQRMFSTVNRVDMFAELNRGSIVLVNTSENLLKEGSATFGRYMIARTMAAAFERATISEKDRVPAFLIVDEAAPYFDDTFEKLLTRVRQFKLGIVIAFQHLEQASQKLKSAIASSTSIKYAGGVGYTDRAWLARDMETIPDFIQQHRKDSKDPPQWSQFACYVRNLTDHAVSLTVPFYQVENMPTMSDAEHAMLTRNNRDRVSHIGLVHGQPKSLASSDSERTGAFSDASLQQPADGSISNRERVGRSLETFRTGALPLIDIALSAAIGKNWTDGLNDRNQLHRLPDGTLHIDTAALLRAMDRFWMDALSPPLTRAHRSYVNELITVRNSAAHDGVFNDDDTARALDTATRLLNAITSAYSPEAVVQSSSPQAASVRSKDRW